MPSDREQFLALMGPVYASTCAASLRHQAAELVAKNQNQPPQGGADGSFTAEQWTAARDALDAAREFKRKFRIVES